MVIVYMKLLRVAKHQTALKPNPQVALLHIKAVEKDNNRWTDGKLKLREDENLYDSLM